jgi:hypothetical protein
MSGGGSTQFERSISYYNIHQESEVALAHDVSNQSLSQMWPAGTQPPTGRRLSCETIHDLALEALVVGMRPYSLHQDAIRSAL